MVNIASEVQVFITLLLIVHLILSAEALDRPALLEPARRSLDLSCHLVHNDTTIVTSISR